MEFRRIAKQSDRKRHLPKTKANLGPGNRGTGVALWNLVHKEGTDMKSISKIFALAAIMVLFSSVTHAEESEIKLRITSRVGTTFLGSTKDHRVLAVVCSAGILNWSADLVFPVQQTRNVLPELTLTTYRMHSASLSANGEKRSAYRPFSKDDANKICAEPNYEYTFSISDDAAQIVSAKSISVQGFDIGRNYL